jgi:hypothetical protein
MRRAVSSTSVVDGRLATARISSLAAAWDFGPPCSRAVDDVLHPGRARRPRSPRAPGRARRTAGRRCARRSGSSGGLALADGADHIGADHRRDDAELDLGGREHRPVPAMQMSQAASQAHAAAQRRAVHAGDGRLRHLGQGAQHAGQRAHRSGSPPRSPAARFIQLRSAPAEKLLPRPASTTTRTAGSASSADGRGELGDQLLVEGVVHAQGGSSTGWRRRHAGRFPGSRSTWRPLTSGTRRTSSAGSAR